MSDEIEEEVLNRVKPTPQDYQQMKEVIEEVMSRLEGLDASVQGSFSKDTWLRGDADLDVFIFFPTDVGKEHLKEKLHIIEERLKGVNYSIAYAEHPYLRAFIKEIEVDIVPALKLEQGSRPMTAVDRTPLHTKFVLEHTDPYTRDQVRILKRFLKGIGIYGAEIRVKGFSGYVAELLVIRYGSFRQVLEEASKWRHQVVVDLVSPKKQFDEPLVVVDPVDPYRNAASAVSLKNLATLVMASRSYLKHPSLDFFYPKDVETEEMSGDILVYRVKSRDSSPDVLWGRVWRALGRIRSDLEGGGFKIVYQTAWNEGEEIYIGIELESLTIPPTFTHTGPYYYDSQYSESFLRANNTVWIGEDGRLYALKRRKFLSAQDLIRSERRLGIELEEVKSWEKRRMMRKRPNWLV